MISSHDMCTKETLSELYNPIAAPLGLVSEQVETLWTDALQLVHGPSMPSIPPGGKMLRPALSLLSAGASGSADTHEFVPLAAAIEILHLAALAHDDVVDGAATRRGTRSLNARWNDHAAVLGGDYLVARAVELLASYDSCPVVTSAFDSVRIMSEAELRCFGTGDEEYTQDDCIALARNKTAILFAVACSTPACLIETAPREALHEYGMALGIAFQLVDDLLDLTQSEEALGKPTCADITEGKRTLPILFLREALSESDAARFNGLRGSELDDADRAWVIAILESTEARPRTEVIAREYAAQACAALDGVKASACLTSMMGLTDFVISRGA
jgi:octaprenyl-diphosphate synthase